MYMNELVIKWYQPSSPLDWLAVGGKPFCGDWGSPWGGPPFQIYMYQFWVVFISVFFLWGSIFGANGPEDCCPAFGLWKKMHGIAVRCRATADQRAIHWENLSAEANTWEHNPGLQTGTWHCFMKQESNSTTEVLQRSCFSNKSRFLRCAYAFSYGREMEGDMYFIWRMGAGRSLFYFHS